MNDPLLVRRFEGFRDLLRDGQRLIERNRPTRDAIGQRLASHQFEDECARLTGFFEAVDLGDVRMIERRQDLRFAVQSRETIRIAREDLRKNF